MGSVVTSLLLALGQMADPRVLRILLKSLAVTLVLFAGVVWGGWYLIDWALAGAGLGDTLFPGAEGLRELASFLMALLGLWLAWRIVAMAVIGFFADEVVQAVEARHYPEIAGRARDLPVAEQFSTSARAAMRALLVNLAVLARQCRARRARIAGHGLAAAPAFPRRSCTDRQGRAFPDRRCGGGAARATLRQLPRPYARRGRRDPPDPS